MGVEEDIDLSAVPRVIAGADPASKTLTIEEGFLFSRVDGTADLGHLVRSSGMGEKAALKALTNLREKGIVTWDGAAIPPGGAVEEPAEVDDVPPWEKETGFDPFELAEEVDLDPSVKKKILWLHRNMEKITHYEILEADRRADSKTLKKAYFKVSREFHPDTYFRKNLGSYKSKVEALFKRVGRAYEVLADDQKRKTYDATLPYEPTPEEIEAERQLQAKKQRDERYAEERRQRMLRRLPMAARKTKARKHFEDAKEHRENNEPVKASNSIKLALTLDPENEDYKRFLEEVGPKASGIRAEKDYRRGQAEESMGRVDEALAAYLRAIEAGQADARPLARAAALLLEQKRDLRQALTFARQARSLEPDNAGTVLTLAHLYEALEMWKNAIRELSRYVQMNPLDERAAERLKNLKKKRR